MSALGHHLVAHGTPLGLSFGALEATVEARPGEWRIGYRHVAEIDRDELVARSAPITTTVARVAADTADHTVVVAPALPDGDLVMRIDPPISVTPRARITLHVGTPVGLSIRTTGGALLLEVPSVRLDRTWFGPSVRDGELCLAIRSQARPDLADLPRRPHRAVTVMTTHNDTPEPFTLERLRVPMRHLELATDSTGRFWTAGIEVALGAEGARVSVRRVPEIAGAVKTVARPRVTGSPNLVLRALDALFAERW